MQKITTLLFGLSFLLLSNICCSQKKSIESEESTVESKTVVNGSLVDKDGIAIPGVNITIKGEAYGTSTDVDGQFSLDAPKDATLVISSTGYVSKEIVIGQGENLEIVIDDGAIKLRYWCCTSHKESPHCSREKYKLMETHNSDEIYERRAM